MVTALPDLFVTAGGCSFAYALHSDIARPATS
jgi:hypothetical protein